MKIAFLFAGQGSQVIGMGKDLYEEYDYVKKIYESSNLDFDLKKICFEGPKDLLDQTKYAQVVIMVTSLAIAEVLRQNNITPSYVAGLSLGEYSALAFSKAIMTQDAISIVSKRGKIMQEALPLGQSTMMAVLNLDAIKIEEIISKVDGVCEIANYNCPGQVVITGDIKSIDEASDLLLKAGAKKCIKLNVSGAFHSSLLDDASKKLKEELEKYHFNTPIYNVVYNVYGTCINADIKDILQKQIKSSVRFDQSIRYMIKQGIDTFIEIGPGTTLSSFVRKIDKDVKVLCANNIESIRKVIGDLNESCNNNRKY